MRVAVKRLIARERDMDEVPRTRPRIGVGISVVVSSIRISAPHNDTAAIVVRGKRPKIYGVRVCATTEDHWT